MSRRAQRRLEASTDRAERHIRRASGRRAAAARDTEAAAAAQEARRRRARSRAPTGFFGSPRFLGVLLAGGMLAVAWVVLRILDVAIPAPLPVALGVIWTVAVAALFVDASTWRARLPFRVDGYTRIAGVSPAADGYVPWIAFAVQIDMRHPSAEATRHQERVLDVLVGRANQLLADNSDAQPGANQTWRREGACAVGAAGNQIYTTRLLERWLRREVRRLAGAYRIDRVLIAARYTGDGYHVFSSTVGI